MRLTLAKKIGGSFAILLLFTGIISYMAARAMSEGSTVSESMASDVIPKLTIFNSMQGNLLLAAMQVRVFFETADPQSYAQGQKYLEASQQKFKELQELNTKYPTPEGTLFIQKYDTLLNKYAPKASPAAMMCRNRRKRPFRACLKAPPTRSRCSASSLPPWEKPSGAFWPTAM